MKVDAISLSGLTLCILVALFLGGVILTEALPYFEPPTEVRQDVPIFLCTYRSFEFTALAFLIFASIACCVTLLRRRE